MPEDDVDQSRGSRPVRSCCTSPPSLSWSRSAPACISCSRCSSCGPRPSRPRWASPGPWPRIRRCAPRSPASRRRIATRMPMQLRTATLQRLSSDVAARTGALFVVITDDNGIRLAHPTPSRIGEEVSTPYEEVLAGSEIVDWQTGTLGESARAKVPVRDASGTPVGEVSVGFERAGVFDDLPPLLAVIALTAAGALGLAMLAVPAASPALGAADPRRAARGARRARAEPDRRARRRRRRRDRDRPAGGRPGEQRRRGSAARARRARRASTRRAGLPCRRRSTRRPAHAHGRALVVGDRMLYLDSRPVVRDGPSARRRADRARPHRPRRADGAAGDGQDDDGRAARAAARVRQPHARRRRAHRRRPGCRTPGRSSANSSSAARWTSPSRDSTSSATRSCTRSSAPRAWRPANAGSRCASPRTRS